MNRNQKLIDGIRNLANFLEANPQLPRNYGEVRLLTFPDDLAEAAKGMGFLEKKTAGAYFSLVKRFGQDVSFEFLKSREQVCERVVTGTKVIPAKEAYLVPAEPEKTVEVFEWKCPDSILEAAAEAHAIANDPIADLGTPDASEPAHEDCLRDKDGIPIAF